MLRPTFIATLIALPFLLSAAPGQTPGIDTSCANTIVHEPLVLYDVNGGTLGGPIDIALTVYNDGQARMSSIGQFGNPSKTELAFPGPAATSQLLVDLSGLGAGQLCDNLLIAADVPTTTLTIFRNATTPRNHTFSWIIANGAYGPVQNRLQNFIQTHFPNF
jgi:hypothetical protein